MKVNALGLHQLARGALFGYPALLEHEHPVVVYEGAIKMVHELDLQLARPPTYRGASELLFQNVPQNGFDDRPQVGEGLFDQQDLRVVDQDPRDFDQFLLDCAQVLPVFVD